MESHEEVRIREVSVSQVKVRENTGQSIQHPPGSKTRGNGTDVNRTGMEVCWKHGAIYI